MWGLGIRLGRRSWSCWTDEELRGLSEEEQRREGRILVSNLEASLLQEEIS
jgi:hypothetical protein